MTEEELNQACQEIGDRVIEFYVEECKLFSKIIVITALTGGLAACVVAAGYKRNNLIDAVNSVFDDLEAGDGEEAGESKKAEPK